MVGEAGSDPEPKREVRGSSEERNPNEQRTAVSVMAFLGAVMVELAGGFPENAVAWALLLVGAAVLALVSGGAVYPVLVRILRQLRKVGPLVRLISRRPDGQTLRRTLRTAVAPLAIVATLAIALVTAPFALGALSRAVFGCPQATELTVLASPGGLDPTKDLVERYGRWTASRGAGCASVNAYVYGVPDAVSSTGVGQGWDAVENGLNPLRDLGPRPDVWFPDSDAAVLRLDEKVREQQIAADTTVAASPVVLAVPASARAALPADAPAWAELVAQADGAGLAVVRADPTVSVSANLATAALYGAPATDGGSGPATSDPRAVERLIGRALDDGDYPLAGDPEVLCRLGQIAHPQAAVIMSERDMVRYNRGEALGGSCGAPARPRSGGERLEALYPPGTVLQHRFVRFHWTGGDSRRARAVAAFAAWLADEPGRRALEQVGLRPVGDPVDPSSFVDAGAQSDPSLDASEITPAVLDRTADAFAQARRRIRALLVLDVSGSMDEAAASSTGPSTRLRAVADGIARSVAAVRDADDVGLWFFPADRSGRGVRKAVPVGPIDDPVDGVPRRSAVAQALAAAGPGGDTPLFDAIAEGVGELGPSDDEAVNKLVVVTDGEDTTSARSVEAVLDDVRTGDVRVYVVAIGGTSCSAAPLEFLTADTGGACYAEAPSGVGPRIADIITS